jgi:hypothetical protein
MCGVAGYRQRSRMPKPSISATCAPSQSAGLEVLQRVEHLHRARDHGVVLHALVVVVHLLEHGVDLQPQGLGLLAEFHIIQACSARHTCVSSYAIHSRQLDAKVPHAAQEAVAALHRRVVPLQRGLGRCGEHGVEARGVGAVLLDQVLRIDAVVLGLGHGAHALVVDGVPTGRSPTAFFSLAPMTLPLSSSTCSTSCGQK